VVQTPGDLDVQGLVTPARYRIRVESPGFDAQDIETTLAGGEVKVLNAIRLEAAEGSIAGQVVDGNGRPLGGVTVLVRAGAFEYTTLTPTAGNVGAFLIEGLETPRTYVLTFTLPGFSSETDALDVRAGEERQGMIASLIGGTGTITGTARDANGAALGGVVVTVQKGTFTAATSTLTTGGVGTFTVTDVPTPGSYTVTFTLAGYLPETRAVTFAGPGTSAGVDASLVPSTATISGTAVRSGVPVAGVTVVLEDGTVTRTTTTASFPNGGFSFANVPPGSYTLTFASQSTATVVVLVRVSAGDSAVRTVDLPAR